MKVTLLGVPSSAGAYCVGVENAPAALRQAGLVSALQDVGCEVQDSGDLTRRSWVPDHDHPYVQNLDTEVVAMKELAVAASQLLTENERLLILGGSCTVALDACAALKSLRARPKLIYIDRHLDLNTPETTTEGSLSWMGMAHALNVDGSAEELSDAALSSPVLRSADLVYLGVDLNQTAEAERSRVDALGLHIIGQAQLCQDPRTAALSALRQLESGPFLVHLDVDVLDFLDAPIAENVKGRNSGPTIAQLGVALAELVRDPDCWGMSIGQLDPAHAIADPTALPRLITALSDSFAGVP